MIRPPCTADIHKYSSLQPSQNQGDAPGNKAVATPIDFVAAFGSISHRSIDEALGGAEASDKSRAIFRAIYKSATAVVRVSLPGGGDKVLTDLFPVDRGVIQGDIFSPICFIIALEHLMRLSDDGGTMTMLGVLISKLEYADDAALVSKNCEEATARVTRIAVEAKERADMEVSVPKTEYMIVRKDECAGAVAGEELEASCAACDAWFIPVVLYLPVLQTKVLYLPPLLACHDHLSVRRRRRASS